MRPKLKSDVLIEPLDVEDGTFYLLQLPSRKSFRITPYLYRILLLMDGERTVTQIAQVISRLEGRTVREVEIQWIIENKLKPLYILEPSFVRKGLKTNTYENSDNSGLKAKGLIPMSLKQLKPFIAGCQHFFNPLALVVLIPAVIYSHIRIYTTINISSVAALVTNTTLLGSVVILAVLYLCIGLHELGHLAAYYRFKHQCGKIRIGFRHFVPTGIASIPSVWSLTRKQRLTFDLGGVWFQALSVLALYMLYLLSGSSAILVALFLLDIGIVWVLTPTSRSDGYWFLTDLLNVISLEKVPNGQTLRKMSYQENSTKKARGSVLTRLLLVLSTVSAILVFICGEWLIISMIAHIGVVYPQMVTDAVMPTWQALLSVRIINAMNNVIRIFLPIVLILGLIVCSVRGFSWVVTREARLLMSWLRLALKRPRSI